MEKGYNCQLFLLHRQKGTFFPASKRGQNRRYSNKNAIFKEKKHRQPQILKIKPVNVSGSHRKWNNWLPTLCLALWYVFACILSFLLLNNLLKEVLLCSVRQEKTEADGGIHSAIRKGRQDLKSNMILILKPVTCSSVVTCGVSGGKSFSLDRCTQLDIPCHLTAVGVAKITLLGPVHFGNSWSWQDPLFPGFKKNLVPGVYLWRNCSFLCSFSGSWQCLVGLVLECFLNLS